MPLTLKESIYRSQSLPRNEEIVRSRAALLESPDRELVEAVLLHNQPAPAIARLTGQSVHHVRRRVQRLTRRLNARVFLETMRLLRFLPADEALLARLHFCAGLSQRTIAQRLGQPDYYVRRRIEQISAELALVRRLVNRRRQVPEA